MAHAKSPAGKTVESYSHSPRIPGQREWCDEYNVATGTLLPDSLLLTLKGLLGERIPVAGTFTWVSIELLSSLFCIAKTLSSRDLRCTFLFGRCFL